MSKGLEALVLMTTGLINKEEWKECYNTIEKELKEYQEIKEIAKNYNWDDITNEIFNVKTDKKYRDLFNSAIVSIQKDYRKARALEIIRKKYVNVSYFTWVNDVHEYNKHVGFHNGVDMRLTEEEYDLLKEYIEL